MSQQQPTHPDIHRLSKKDTTERMLMASTFVLLLLVADQAIKFAVKLNMMLGESIQVTDWFYIYFTENPGMAFGWEVFSKGFLTVFRIVASLYLAYLLWKVASRSYGVGFLGCIAAILAGAVGNIIDSIFYGQIFSHSTGQVATLFPSDGGYAGWLHGKVVDMLYFPIINTTWPTWVPWVGGDEWVFFQPIFNFADACISVGVICLLLFYSHSFSALLNTPHRHQEPSAHREPPTDEAI